MFFIFISSEKLIILNTYKEILFFPKADICILDNVDGFHLYSLAYLLIAFVATGLYFFAAIKLILKDPSSLQTIKKYIFLFILFCFFLLIILQQYSRYYLLSENFTVTKRSSKHEKNLILFKEKYIFPNEAKFFVKKGQKVGFHTDMNCQIDPRMYNKSLLKYLLYPDIILTENTKNITNYTLLFYLANPEKYISANNMKVLLNIENKLILTRKK